MKFTKWHINSSSMVLSFIIFIISFLAYIYFSFIDNNTTVPTSANGVTIPQDLNCTKMLKDILLVIISVLGTNLLLNVVIQKGQNNDFFTDFFANDIISSPEFYENLDDKNTIKILKCLESKQYFNNNVIITEMYDSIRHKLNKIDKEYYFEKCTYNVTCSVYDNFFEKNIVRAIRIRSYKSSAEIRNFNLANYTSKTVNGHKSYELKSLVIDGHELDVSRNVTLKSIPIIDLMSKKNGYDSKINLQYNGKLSLRNDADTTITVNYIVRSTLDDITSTFRASEPCKNFQLIYKIDPNSNYKVTANAFGFWDSADSSPNNLIDHEININFNDWIFEDDGVTVSLSKKHDS